jgi:uncharacterized protein
VGIDPRRGERAIEIMERFVRRYNAKSLKVYPATGWFPNEESVMSFWKHADDLGLVVVSHAGAAWGPLEEKFSHPFSFDDVLRRYSDLKVIIAHLGGKFRQETYELCAEHPHCFTDISALKG